MLRSTLWLSAIMMVAAWAFTLASEPQTMRLYVARHGDAGDYSTDPSVERTRGLIPTGRRRVESVARALESRGEAPSIIISSPFARALETADVLGRVLRVPVSTDENLQPDRDLYPYLWELLEDDGQKNVMLVGHHDNLVPALERLSNSPVDKLAKGEVRRLKVDRDTGEWKERYRLVPEGQR